MLKRVIDHLLERALRITVKLALAAPTTASTFADVCAMGAAQCR